MPSVAADRMDWVILSTAAASLLVSLIGLITGVLSLIQSFRSTRTANRNEGQIVLLKHEFNSRLTELLELKASEARLQGHKEGVREERDRPRDPPDPPDETKRV
jgi:hypothetical protein